MNKKYGKRFFLILFILVLIIASRFSFFNPVRDGFRFGLAVPAQLLDAATAKVKNSFLLLFTIGDLAEENSELKQQVLTKEAEIARLEYVQGENERLKRDLNFAQARPDLRLLPAQIIHYAPTSLYQAVVINKGEHDGVKESQAVVASGFLVGKVGRVSEKTSEVWLLNNRNLLTPVMLTTSQTIGLLKGSIRGLVVDNIPLDTRVEKGDRVVTSSLEGQYPAGIAVGQVEEIISSKEEIFLTLRITTPVNANDLATVLVVQAKAE